jgi:hypothetical protein
MANENHWDGRDAGNGSGRSFNYIDNECQFEMTQITTNYLLLTSSEKSDESLDYGHIG